MVKSKLSLGSEIALIFCDVRLSKLYHIFLVSIPYETLNKIVDLCEKYDVWLIMDNTYEHFDHNSANTPPVQDEDENFPFKCSESSRVINIFSFSKGYSMAGFRVGYLTVSKSGKGPDTFQQMLKVKLICKQHNT